MKKRVLILLLILFSLVPLFAESNAEATLTLQTKVRDIVVHGFKASIPEGDLSGTSVIQFMSQGEENPQEDLSVSESRLIDSTDIEDFDFSKSSYEIGYYLFAGNTPTNFTISLNITNFVHDDVESFSVPWSLALESAGVGNMALGNETISSGTQGSEILTTTTSSSIKWGVLSLKANFDQTNQNVLYPLSGTYTATVVAHISTN
jgi:hypothetical protein